MAERCAFVTGATGFIGTNLVAQLTAAGWRVVALRRKTSDVTYLKPFPVAFVEGSVTDAGALRRGLPEGVDAVFHMAADVRLYHRRDAAQTPVNVEGTRNMVAAALDKGAKRFVHTSTASTYGLHRKRITEQTPSNAMEVPINYFRTKRLGEREVEAGIERGLNAVIMCPINVMGPYDRTHWARMIQMIHNRALPAVAPGRASFSHVREVVKAHIAAVDKGQTGQHYLLGGADATYVELARIIQAVVGGKAPRHALPVPLYMLLGHIMPIVAGLKGRSPSLTPEIARALCSTMLVDSSKAERELGYRPTTLREMVVDQCEWLREEGLLAGPRGAPRPGEARAASP